MTDAKTLFDDLDAELRTSGALSETTCARIGAVADPAREGLAPVFAVLGCESLEPASGVAGIRAPLPEELRAQAIKLMLLRFRAQTDDPRWSSAMLEKMLAAAVAIPGARVTDVIGALHELLGEVSTIGDSTANLIGDVVKGAFTAHRRSYEAGDLSSVARRMTEGARPPTAGQAYLALLALPEAQLATCRQAILRALDGTARAAEARRMLDTSSEP